MLAPSTRGQLRSCKAGGWQLDRPKPLRRLPGLNGATPEAGFRPLHVPNWAAICPCRPGALRKSSEAGKARRAPGRMELPPSALGSRGVSSNIVT